MEIRSCASKSNIDYDTNYSTYCIGVKKCEILTLWCLGIAHLGGSKYRSTASVPILYII